MDKLKNLYNEDLGIADTLELDEVDYNDDVYSDDVDNNEEDIVKLNYNTPLLDINELDDYVKAITDRSMAYRASYDIDNFSLMKAIKDKYGEDIFIKYLTNVVNRMSYFGVNPSNKISSYLQKEIIFDDMNPYIIRND